MLKRQELQGEVSNNAAAELTEDNTVARPLVALLVNEIVAKSCNLMAVSLRRNSGCRGKAAKVVA